VVTVNSNERQTPEAVSTEPSTSQGNVKSRLGQLQISTHQSVKKRLGPPPIRPSDQLGARSRLGPQSNNPLQLPPSIDRPTTSGLPRGPIVERWLCPWREEENKLIPPDIVTENREPSPEPQPFNEPVPEQQQQQKEEGEEADVLDLFGNEFPSDQ